MKNIPWYKKLLAIVCIAMLGIEMAALFIFSPVSKYVHSNAYWLLFAAFIFIICHIGGQVYLKYSKSDHKEYYHTLWTGAWAVSLCMLMICIVLGLIF